MKNKKLSRAPAHKAMLQQKFKLGVIPKTDEEWITLADDMLAWAHQETSFAIEDFPLSRGYSPHKFYKWQKHNEYFADALEFTTYMIGARRERAARERKVDSTIILKTMPLYNFEYREFLMSKIHKHQESRPAQFTIVMDKITSPIPMRGEKVLNGTSEVASNGSAGRPL